MDGSKHRIEQSTPSARPGEVHDLYSTRDRAESREKHAPAQQDRIVSPPNGPLDVKLVRPWTQEDQQAEPYEKPFWVRFSGIINGQQKDLHYVAANHIMSDPEAGLGLERSTLKTVREAMEQGDPQCVIYEGRQLSIDTMNEIRQSYAAEKQSVLNSREAEYVAFLADQRGIPYKGGEPTFEQQVAAMKGEYSQKDLMAFKLVLQINLWNAKKTVNAENFEAEASNYLREDPDFQQIPVEERLTVEEFKEWYAGHQPGRSFLDVKSNDYEPNASGTYLQRLSAARGVVRERQIVKTMNEALASYDRILVVYGVGHLVKERKALEAVFPKQQASQPFPPQR